MQKSIVCIKVSTPQDMPPPLTDGAPEVLHEHLRLLHLAAVHLAANHGAERHLQHAAGGISTGKGALLLFALNTKLLAAAYLEAGSHGLSVTLLPGLDEAILWQAMPCHSPCICVLGPAAGSIITELNQLDACAVQFMIVGPSGHVTPHRCC
jgi:hypothetical protein